MPVGFQNTGPIGFNFNQPPLGGVPQAPATGQIGQARGSNDLLGLLGNLGGGANPLLSIAGPALQGLGSAIFGEDKTTKFNRRQRGSAINRVMRELESGPGIRMSDIFRNRKLLFNAGAAMRNKRAQSISRRTNLDSPSAQGELALAALGDIDQQQAATANQALFFNPQFRSQLLNTLSSLQG